MPMRTMPVIGSVTAAMSASIGVAICVIASRKITTSTSLLMMSAITNAAHLPIHPLVASQDAPANAIGAQHHGNQQQRLTDQQREPDDEDRGDHQPGQEDRHDRPDTGSGDVDAGQAGDMRG